MALVVGEPHLNRVLQVFGPFGLRVAHQFLHRRDGIDEVEALALDHLKGDRALPVEPRGARPVLERQPDFGEVAQRHHPVTVHLDRQAIDVLHVVERGRDLDRRRAGVRGDLARRDQLVVVGHDLNQLARRHVVGFELQGVDQDLHHLVPRAGELGFEHGLDPFHRVLHFAGEADQRAFRHRAGEVDDDDGEFREVDLVDRILVGPVGELGLGGIHRVAHIGDDLGAVPSEFEFEREARVILRRRAGHGLEPVDIGELLFHWPDQQVFTVLGGNAGEGDRDEQRRNLDIRLALFRQADIGGDPGGERQRDERDHHPCAGRSPVDDAVHVPDS